MSIKQAVTNKLPQNDSENQQECLAEMNRSLKKLKIEEQWGTYDEIRLIGQPDRLLYYVVVGIVFLILLVFGSQIVLFKYQNIVLQISAMVLALVIKASLPKHTFTIQFSTKKSYDITFGDKERFEIVKNMYDYMRSQDTAIRIKKIDDLKNKKKTN